MAAAAAAAVVAAAAAAVDDDDDDAESLVAGRMACRPPVSDYTVDRAAAAVPA